MTSQNVQTFLRQYQHDLGRRRRDSEAEVALACLPKETRTYQYESMSQMEGVSHAVDDNGGYCVFVGVPERVVTHDRDAARIGIITYYRKSKILITKMPTEHHEVASTWLSHSIQERMGEMGMKFHTYLKDIRSTTIEHKEADLALRPRNLPQGRTEKWPTLVLETGFSESHQLLDNDARRWIQKSNGHVKVAITAKVSRTKITVRKYGPSSRTRAAVIQTITMTKRGQQPIRITGGPLRIPFRDIFLRVPVRNQGDLVFTQTDLEQWASLIWEDF